MKILQLISINHHVLLVFLTPDSNYQFSLITPDGFFINPLTVSLLPFKPNEKVVSLSTWLLLFLTATVAILSEPIKLKRSPHSDEIATNVLLNELILPLAPVISYEF